MFQCCSQPEEQGGSVVEAVVPAQEPEVVVLEPVEEEPVKEEPAPPEPEPVKEEPPAPEKPVKAVECTISRQAGSAWGMTFEYAGRFLLIDAIKSGAVAKYNEGVDEKAQLRTQDYITMVNGLNPTMSTTEMLDVFKNAGLMSVTLKVGRPEQMNHQIVRREDGKGWGFGVKCEEKQKVVQVKDIAEGGAAQMYNMERELEAQLQPDDLITACNGKSGSANDIVAILKDKTVKTLELTVVRVGKLAEQERVAGA